MVNSKIDFTITMTELRTVRTILKTLIDRRLLPEKQAKVVVGLLKKMDSANMGEFN